MLNRIIILFTILLTSKVTAQTYELGVTLGATNYVGEIGSRAILDPTEFGFGVIGKWNRSDRHSFRASLSYLPISGADIEAEGSRRKARNLNFKNSVKEISIGLEYTFWEWDLHNGEKQLTPYLYTGITVFSYGALARAQDNSIKAFDDVWSAGIPIVLGLKTNIAPHLVIGAELGARYTFTDNLDGSNPEDLELPAISGATSSSLIFGNLNNNDWYFYNAITITYTFGRKPCYCVF